jgi:hypothetical protein
MAPQLAGCEPTNPATVFVSTRSAGALLAVGWGVHDLKSSIQVIGGKVLFVVEISALCPSI